MSGSDKFRIELERINEKYKSLDKEKRVQVASALREELIRKNEKISAEDQKMLDEFSAGNAQLDDLVALFQGRI